jgi:hypothetical protein
MNDFDISKIVVGTKVAAFGGYMSEPQAVLIITKILKQYVETNDGRKWDMNGYSRPRSSGYYRAYITQMTDEIQRSIDTKRAQGKIEDWVRDNLRKAPLEKLRQVLDAIDASVPRSTTTAREMAAKLNIKVDEAAGQERVDMETGKRMSDE